MRVYDLKGDFSVVILPAGKASYAADVWEGPRNSRGTRIGSRADCTTEHSALRWATAFVEGWIANASRKG